MGDEQLNFTEDEARCWADDPRNQPQNGAFAGVMAACILLLIALIAGILVTSSVRPISDDGQIHVGVLLVP